MTLPILQRHLFQAAVPAVLLAICACTGSDTGKKGSGSGTNMNSASLSGSAAIPRMAESKRAAVKQARTEYRGAVPTVSVRTSVSSPLPKLIYGFNTNAMNGAFSYTDAVYQTSFAELHPNGVRFPGGTSANFYHWETGEFQADANLGAAAGRMVKRNKKNLERLGAQQGGKVSFDEFMALCQRNNVEPVIVINALTGTPAEAAGWVRHAKEKGYRIRAWEIGNELYLPQYKRVYPNPGSYVAAGAQFAAAMKREDSDIVVAVPAAPNGFHGPNEKEAAFQRAWNSSLAAARFYDAYTVHLYTYPKNVGPADPQAMREYLFGSSEVALARALGYYRQTFGDRAMWVTEWNLAKPSNPVMNTMMAADYAGDFFIGLLNAPTVKVAMYHVLAGPGKSFAMLSPAAEGDPPGDAAVRRTPYEAFRVIGEAMNGADTKLGTSLSNTPTMNGAMDFTGNSFPSLRVAAVKGSNGTWVLVSNRSGSNVPFAITLDGTPVTGNVVYDFVGNPSLSASNGGNESVRGNGQIEVRAERWEGPAGELTLPANSVGVVHLP